MNSIPKKNKAKAKNCKIFSVHILQIDLSMLFESPIYDICRNEDGMGVGFNVDPIVDGISYEVPRLGIVNDAFVDGLVLQIIADEALKLILREL